MKRSIFLILVLLLLIVSITPLWAEQLNEDEKKLQLFIDNYVKIVAPLEKEANLAEWNAYVTGKKEYYDRKSEYSLKLDIIHSNKYDYKKLLDFKSGGKIHDPLLVRQLNLMINEFGPKQIDEKLLEKITNKESEVQLAFNTYRGKIDGKEVTEKDIYAILGSEKDRTKRKKAWEAQKDTAKVVAPLLIQLVKLRNEAARNLGYENYYVMKVHFDDQDVKELRDIFHKLYEETEGAFTRQKGEMDTILAKRLGIKVEEMRPWDYSDPFFQDAPGIFTSDINKYFQNKDIPAIVMKFYEGVGLPASDILKRSDLYEKPGKSQHAFCYNIDRAQDIRVLLNMRDDEESCATLLHEMGHGVYDKYIDQSLPWLCREPAHIFTTEATAMMFERLTKNPVWLNKMVGVPEKEAEELGPKLKENLALQQLVFCRWTEVMFNFEQELYRDPDQDLSKVWWDTVEKYQKLRRPEGRHEQDWASKIHFTSAPVYYHNYMLGEIMASQMVHTMGTKVLNNEKGWSQTDFLDKPALGGWLKTNIFAPGARYRWNELLIRSTGESLNPRYFAEQFID